jgi:hypothetical protein
MDIEITPINRIILRTLRKSPVIRDYVVADAVAVEPVSAAKFPANRDKEQGILQNRGSGRAKDCK